LTQENQVLSDKVEDLTAKSGKSIKLQIENGKLKKQVEFFRSNLARVLEFIEKFNLEKNLKRF
jgi:hypothetical protein